MKPNGASDLTIGCSILHLCGLFWGRDIHVVHFDPDG